MTPLSWMVEQAERHCDVRIVSLIERGRDERQDVVAIRKASFRLDANTRRVNVLQKRNLINANGQTAN